MIQNVERRNEDRGRIPFELSVELGHDGFDESFEADAVDLSPGGLSLRTACLPEIGDELMCRFDAMPDGTQVSSRGRVVWTQTKGDRSGEFGLRFTDMDDESKALIDELVAERRSRLQAMTEEAEKPRLAELQLAGVSAPLSARLLRSGGGEAVFEQTLPLLELGRGVVARAGHALGKGSIAEVKLTMQGGTPTLAVTVRFDERRSLFGEFEWEPKPEPAVDTVPDLDAPDDAPEPSLRASEPEATTGRVTMVEFEASAPSAMQMDTAQPDDDEDEAREAAATSEMGDMPAALASPEALTREDEHVDEGDEDEARGEDGDDDQDDDQDEDQDDSDAVEHATARQASLPLDLAPAARPAAAAPRVVVAPGLDARVSASTHAATGSAPAAKMHLEESDHEPWAHPLPDTARSSVLVRLLRVLVAIGAAMSGATAWLVKVCGPGAKTFAAHSRSFVTSRALPMARNAVSTLVQRAHARPRRVTTAPAAMQKAERIDRNLLRSVAIAGAAVSAVALSVYALAPSPADSAIDVHRQVRVGKAKARARKQAEAAAMTSTADTAAANPTAGAPVAAGPTTVNAAYASAMAGQPLMAAAQPSVPVSAQAVRPAAAAVPAAGILPAASPYAVDVRDASRSGSVATTKPAAAATTTATFGQRSVPSAQRFVLRMSAPVKALQGNGDKGGFTVVAQGASSLDKAGPIAASASNVARAMVWNKNGQAELTIRFTEGKSPAYRVTARGAELEILIGQ